MSRKIRLLTIAIIIMSCQELFADKPLLAVAGIDTDSPRTITVSYILENHLINISNSLNVFDPINPALLKKELQRFNCLEEECLLKFADTAEINLLIRGELYDNDSHLTLNLTAYGMDIPYQGKIIYQYNARIPVFQELDVSDYSKISEEHAGFFLSGLLKNYKHAYFIKNDGQKSFINNKISGKHTLYRLKETDGGSRLRAYGEMGSITLSEGKIISEDKSGYTENDFILINLTDRHLQLYDYSINRKKALSLQPAHINDTFYTFIFSVPASATMPIAAPLFGYYNYGDWSGLTLWACNTLPYLYIEYDGFTNNPADLRKSKKDVSGEVITNNRFAWYMLLLGGLPLFVDAYSHEYLDKASNYQGMQSLMGNDMTAGYLALVSAGGGHFYKGDRFWGYIYFHLDNILLYMTIKEFSPDERYNSEDKSYKKDKINKTLAYSLIGALTTVKIVEVIHVLTTEDRVRNGKIEEKALAIEPVIYIDGGSSINLGLLYRY